MKKLLLLFAFLFPMLSFAQDNSVAEEVVNGLISNKGFSLGINGGYDFPFYKNNFTYYDAKPGIKAGLKLDYNFGHWGLGLDYDFILNQPKSLINDVVYYDSLLTLGTSMTSQSQKIIRHFVGLGPNYNFFLLRNKLNVQIFGRAGISIISGGELVDSSKDPTIPTNKDYHLLFSGLDDNIVLSLKGGIDFDYAITKKLVFSLGGYYLYHNGVAPDNNITLDKIGKKGIIYGHSPIHISNDEHYIGIEDASVVAYNEEKQVCSDYSSIGINLGVKYRFGKSNNKKKKCSDCGCPDDGHNVVVTIRDEASNKVIPGGDVAIKDMDGNIVATGTSNSFGVVDFGQIYHDDYSIVGNVYGIETTSSSLTEDEFTPNAVIQKTVLYTDLRFILKGVTVNKRSKAREPSVVVSLTNTRSRDVQQNSSDGKGEFAFRLDKNSSYEVVGIKENKLSDIDRASTVGLRRSTTLFVDLELGLDDFDCGKGTVLDIKYEYDKDELLAESKFELERLVRYMTDHGVSKIELSSHTDSRGPKDYNQDLSQRRAQSAVNYIMSKGVLRSRISANGYGEDRLLNNCKDGIKCSEAEHRINRRTEAKLLCR